MTRMRNETNVSESYVMSPQPTVVMVTTAHQNASGMDLKKLFSLPASAKYTADENSTTPLRTSTHRRRWVECDTQRAGARRASGAGAYNTKFYLMSPQPTVVIVITAHQKASTIEEKFVSGLSLSAKKTADEKTTTPAKKTYESGARATHDYRSQR